MPLDPGNIDDIPHGTRLITKDGYIKRKENLANNEFPAHVIIDEKLEGFSCILDTSKVKLTDGSVAKIKDVPVMTKIDKITHLKKKPESSNCHLL